MVMPSYSYGYHQHYPQPSYDAPPDYQPYSRGYPQPAPAQLDLHDPDPFDHSKYSASASYEQYAPYYNEPFSLPHQVAAPMIQPRGMDIRYAQQTTNYTASRYTTQAPYPDPGPAPQDEKIVGGVSAQLDYEMEQMIDFVVQMSSGMYALFQSRICLADIDILRSIRPVTHDRAKFRQWVSQVLNATRLPSATILLSLSYLAIRVRRLSDDGRYFQSERALYQMLTVAMILGSKFLDDNTFQNRSWAEVSNIAVGELNKDEREWLCTFDHKLHHDVDCTAGFSSWQKEWDTYKADAAMSRSERSLRPLNTTSYMSRSRPVSTSPSRYHLPAPLEPSCQDAYSSRYSPYSSWYNRLPLLEHSPSTAGHTGPNTPNYYGSQGNWNAPQEPLRQQAYGYLPTPQYTPSSAGWAGFELPKPAYNGAMWNSHGSFCQCPTCRQTQLFQPRSGPVMAA